jgi:hypothetical protein
MNVCLKVVGGGPAKGRGCPKFEVLVYHMFCYGDNDEVNCCVYEVCGMREWREGAEEEGKGGCRV